MLVAEDDDLVRKLVVRVLARAGYSVVGVATASEAARLAHEAPRSIDLLLTDVVLPDLRGPELFEAVRHSQPDARVIFMSGYPEEVAERAPGTPLPGPFLRKPFDPPELVRTIGDVLAREPTG
ncbi:MAG TPA: response regulator [Longimicrobiales bacterium]|nr:response regulator [Longimicrobiales bacterium]